MKKVILGVAMVFAASSLMNANASENVETLMLENSIEEKSHYKCKINAISIAHTAAEILGTKPSVKYFKEVYKECMGY